MLEPALKETTYTYFFFGCNIGLFSYFCFILKWIRCNIVGCKIIIFLLQTMKNQNYIYIYIYIYNSLVKGWKSGVLHNDLIEVPLSIPKKAVVIKIEMTLTSLAVGQTAMAFWQFPSADSETFCGQTHVVFRNKGKHVPGFVNFFTIKPCTRLLAEAFLIWVLTMSYFCFC